MSTKTKTKTTITREQRLRLIVALRIDTNLTGSCAADAVDSMLAQGGIEVEKPKRYRVTLDMPATDRMTLMREVEAADPREAARLAAARGRVTDASEWSCTGDLEPDWHGLTVEYVEEL